MAAAQMAPEVSEYAGGQLDRSNAVNAPLLFTARAHGGSEKQDRLSAVSHPLSAMGRTLTADR
jgi:hypothetical protein